MSKFTLATLSQWAQETQARVDAIVKGSTQEVCRIAQTIDDDGGRLPFDVGTLRASFQSSLNGSVAGKGPESYALVVGKMETGDVAHFEWTVEYAARMNYGFVGEDKLGREYNQSGTFFLEGATMQWQNIVSMETSKAQIAVGNNTR